MKKYLVFIFLTGCCFGQLFELTHNGASRIYWVDYPENAIDPVPLVVNMHGRNNTLYAQMYISEMSSFANSQNIAVAYPQGINSWGVPAWNSGVWWDNSIYDDVGHINTLIDSVVSNFDIDTNRIYACGFSNGGFMAYDLACELSDRIVAFGSVSGNFMMNSNQDCTNEREIPIIHIHGTDDFIVRYYPPTIDFSMTALEAMDWWSVENNLTEQSYLQLNNNVTFFTNYSLNSTTKFTHIQVEGGDHEWFDYDWGFHASEELLNFFMQYSMTDFYDHSPVLSLIENHQAYEDTPLKINISATSPVGSQITYSAGSDTSAIGVFIEQDSLVVWFQQDWTGLGNISVIANDENLLSDTTFFTVTVLPVNDPPSNFELIFPTIFDTIPVSINADETIQFGWHRSNDVDSEISYDISVIIDHPNELFTKEYQGIFDTTFGIPSYDYAILMNDLELSNSNFSYFIEASDGEFTVVSDSGKFVFLNSSLNVKSNNIPENFFLYQNYPNPFNQMTTINYDLPKNAIVDISVYDMKGRLVKNILKNFQTLGHKSIQWNATNYQNETVSAGMYIYIIQADHFRRSRKMVLLK